MYCWNKVRWCVIIIDDGISSLKRPLGCIGKQDELSVDSRMPHMDWFLDDVRVFQWCGRWWARLMGNPFTKEDMVQQLNGLELVWSYILDAFCGGGELVGYLNDAISGSHYWDGNGLTFVTERVRDTFVTGVAHDDLYAPIMLERRTDVPRVQCT